jgi:hypothetical protein
VLDAVSLIRSTLADENASWLKEAAAVEALWRVARMLVVTLETAFLASDLPEAIPASSVERRRWRADWERSAARLAREGIAVVRDETAADAYLELRARWSPHIARLALAMAYRPTDIAAHG